MHSRQLQQLYIFLYRDKIRRTSFVQENLHLRNDEGGSIHVLCIPDDSLSALMVNFLDILIFA